MAELKFGALILKEHVPQSVKKGCLPAMPGEQVVWQAEVRSWPENGRTVFETSIKAMGEEFCVGYAPTLAAAVDKLITRLVSTRQRKY